MLESLINKVSFKKRLQHRCFPVKFAKFLRTPILKNIRDQLIPYVKTKFTAAFRSSVHMVKILPQTKSNFHFNAFQSISAHCCISYRNHSFDLASKSNDWFLYEMQHWATLRNDEICRLANFTF